MKPIRSPFSRRRRGDAKVCHDAVELLARYLDDALSPQDRTRLESHLSGCPHCSEYLEQLRASIRLSGQLDPGRLDPETRTALIDLYRAWRAPS